MKTIWLSVIYISILIFTPKVVMRLKDVFSDDDDDEKEENPFK